MLKLFYYTGANFGDALSPLVVEKLSGQKFEYAHFVHADLSAIGSVLYRGDAFLGDWEGIRPVDALKAVPHMLHAMLSKPIDIWGSGFLNRPDFKRPFVKKRLRVHALRGKFTHEILAKYGFVAADAKIPYGDPGLLAADLLGMKKNPKYSLGIIPHVDEAHHGKVLVDEWTRKGYNSIKLIDASQAPDRVVGEIARCEKILSSSLHGLIVSDSLGIPNRHLVLSTLGHTKEDFYLKFKDYYSAFDEDLPSEDEFGLRDVKKVDQVKLSLLESFPYRETRLRHRVVAGVSDGWHWGES